MNSLFREVSLLAHNVVRGERESAFARYVSAEQLAHTIHKSLVLRLHILAKLTPELFQQLLGSGGEPCWHFEPDLNQLIASSAAESPIETVPAHAQYATRLRGSWDFKLHLAPKCGHIELPSESGLRKCDRHRADHVVATPPIIGVLADLDAQLQITRLVSGGDAIATSAHTATRLVFNSSGDRHLDAA